MDRPTILWVEDNQNDVRLVREAFHDKGSDVEFVVSVNAIQAFSYIEGRYPYGPARRNPDLIIIDLNLPAIKGTTVLNEVKRHKPWKDIPVVVLTSSSNPHELRACTDLGANECITKPHAYEGYLELVEKLRRYLPNAGGESSGGRPSVVDPGNGPLSGLFSLFARKAAAAV